MRRDVTLVGLDCGSTTSCLVAARGRLATGALGRVEVTQLSETFRSPVILTPFVDRQIDAQCLATYLDEWLAAAEIRPDEIFSGGALITGLAAQRENADWIRQMLAGRLADAVVAAADAPRLESWLAFMGNCHALSVAQAETPIINLDLGGGTTNIALGQAGQVRSTGSLFVGARHFQFEPGSYRLKDLTPLGKKLLAALNVQSSPNAELSRTAVDRIVDYYVRLLVAAIYGELNSPGDQVAAAHIQAPLDASPEQLAAATITLSGGVGRLIYQMRQWGRTPAISAFGDLGGELAEAILRCPEIANRLTLVPEGLGHATVFGLLRHSTELSGSTLYLPQPQRLPLANVPLLGHVDQLSTDAHVAELLKLATGPAAAMQVQLAVDDIVALKHVSELLARGLERHPLADETMLVLLVDANLGKTLGSYVTRWGKLKLNLMVIDEVAPRDAQFVRLGRLCETVVPLWLYAVR